MVGYMIFQTTVRTGPDVAKVAVGETFQNLETAKRDVQSVLLLSEQAAFHTVGVQGDSYEAERYWFANGQPIPPEIDEVLYALSNVSSKNMQAYITGEKFAEVFPDAAIAGYACLKSVYPGDDKCGEQDSSQCETSGVSAIDGRIQMRGETPLSYQGPITGEPGPQRFFWLWKRGADKVREHYFQQMITQHQRANCRNPGPADEKFEAAIIFACEEFRKAAYDDFVDIDCPIQCRDGDTSCVNQDVTVNVPKTCYEGGQSQSAPQANACVNGCEGLSFQGVRDVKIKVKITDRKFNVPAMDANLAPLKLEFAMFLDYGQFNHVPIDS